MTPKKEILKKKLITCLLHRNVLRLRVVLASIESKSALSIVYVAIKNKMLLLHIALRQTQPLCGLTHLNDF